MSIAHPPATASRRAATPVRAIVVCLLSAALLPLGTVDRASAAAVDHLVVSEVVTGGASASDELIEIYNPSSAPLPLEGLELVYVTASGATVSRRASWSLGAPEMPAGAHLLVANELGSFAQIADALYASGMAATGGSVALRILGASTAIDAVGWGTAASAWLEGLPADVPPAGSSLERRPGGSAGSTIDTDSNLADFIVRAVPDPQNAGSPPVPDPTQASPTPTAAPTATPTATQTPTPTPTSSSTPAPTATPAPAPIGIAAARALADGTTVTVEGDALTASDFTDGGGYLSDATGGIAVLLDGGAYTRGDHLIVTGTLDDRFAQRTVRAAGSDMVITGTAGDPDPVTSPTGSVNEALEGRLVRVQGSIAGSPTSLSGGLAFDVDDGSGAIRVVVGTATGIDTAGWTDGVAVRVIGVAGQRDSSGTGLSGYRVQPRAADDVEVLPSPSPTPSPTASGPPGPQPTPTPSASSGPVVPIASARAAAKNTRLTVRGVVTLASGTVEAGSAVIQDGSGAILLRLGDEAGSVSRGQLLEVAGTRSTKSGMESLRVSIAPRRLGTAVDPTPRALRSGDAAEAFEAQLVVVRGAVVASARTASSGTVSFEVDDGSGPLRVVLGASLAADGEPFSAGTWVEVLGVLGQETTGAQPMRGYRVWPRSPGDVRILAAATGTAIAASSGGGGGGSGAGSSASLAAIGGAGLADLRVGATLVVSAWPELKVAGLLWDGSRLVGITPASAARVEQATAGNPMPVSLELGGLRDLGEKGVAGIALVSLGDSPGDTVVSSAAPAPPSSTLPAPGDPPSWVSVVGRVTNDGRRQVIEVAGARIVIQRLCERGGRLPEGTVGLIGVATADPPRIIVACDGVRAAPALALAASVQSGTTRPPKALGAPFDRDLAATPGHRSVASMLLAIGVAILVLAVIVGRRFGSAEPDAAAAEDADPEESAQPEPRLALVRLPEEHGP